MACRYSYDRITSPPAQCLKQEFVLFDLLTITPLTEKTVDILVETLASKEFLVMHGRELVSADISPDSWNRSFSSTRPIPVLLFTYTRWDCAFCKNKARLFRKLTKGSHFRHHLNSPGFRTTITWAVCHPLQRREPDSSKYHSGQRRVRSMPLVVIQYKS